ncbi:MAG: endonuclease IV, partial [Candidatus Diapherotrites archaeon]|nr:endonuclease IV [Candidatus Diapherotrites archaeon]
MTLKLGAHVSVAGGFINALHALDDLGANCGAIFNHSPRSYKFSDVPESKIEEFKTAYQAGNYDPIVVHSTYLLNLATP